MANHPDGSHPGGESYSLKWRKRRLGQTLSATSLRASQMISPPFTITQPIGPAPDDFSPVRAKSSAHRMNRASCRPACASNIRHVHVEESTAIPGQPVATEFAKCVAHADNAPGFIRIEIDPCDKLARRSPCFTLRARFAHRAKMRRSFAERDMGLYLRIHALNV